MLIMHKPYREHHGPLCHHWRMMCHPGGNPSNATPPPGPDHTVHQQTINKSHSHKTVSHSSMQAAPHASPRTLHTSAVGPTVPASMRCQLHMHSSSADQLTPPSTH